MNLKELHESWVKTGYPSRTEIRKAIEGLLTEQGRQLRAYQPTEWIAVPACCCKLCEKARRIMTTKKTAMQCMVEKWKGHASIPTDEILAALAADNKGNDKGLWEQVEKLLHEPCLAIDAWRKVERIKTEIAKFKEK